MIMNELLKPDQRKHFPITKCLRKILADKVNEYKSTHQYSHIINNYPVTIFSKKQCRFLDKNAFTSQSVFFEKQSAHIDEVKNGWMRDMIYPSTWNKMFFFKKCSKNMEQMY